MTALLPLSLLGVLVWGEWGLRQLLGLRYRPFQNEHTETSSVIVPVYKEDPSILERALESWMNNEPDEIILVIDHTETVILELADGWQKRMPTLRTLTAREPGKRHALVLGMKAARFDVVVLTDSDTLWEAGLLPKLLMPFANQTIGGVGCRQNVLQPGTSIWRQVADWMMDVRFLHFLPAIARKHAVPCISGRTAAYRRAAVIPLLDDLEFEYFWGKRCYSGDDGRLTWLILSNGWKAAYQMHARAWTVFPHSFRGFVKQRVRWSRNSYRCYSRAIFNGWLWQQPTITSMSVLQNLIGPFTLLIPVFFLVHETVASNWTVVAVILLWLILGRAIKSMRHFRSEPRALLLLPLITLIFIVVMIPIKLYALVTMNKQGWITRTPDSDVAEGQEASSLAPLSA